MFSIDFSTLSEADLLSLSHTQLKDYLPDWERGIWEFIEQWQDVSIEHIKVFTSGSTGQPSSVTHSKEAMRQSAQMTCRALQLKKGRPGATLSSGQ
ncbi:MAG: hypothetical protein IPP77_02295 [Bacteroidetes bacterium]|nr:hypothetical protein [Bacteroidota bacterium]